MSCARMRDRVCHFGGRRDGRVGFEVVERESDDFWFRNIGGDLVLGSGCQL
jgi:hypothetical protein